MILFYQLYKIQINHSLLTSKYTYSFISDYLIYILPYNLDSNEYFRHLRTGYHRHYNSRIFHLCHAGPSSVVLFDDSSLLLLLTLLDGTFNEGWSALLVR